MPTPTLSSDSTRAQLIAAFTDNADYDLQTSAAAGISKARVFIQAGRMLLARPIVRTSSGGRGGEEIELDPNLTQKQIDQAVNWLMANNRAASVLPRQLVPGDDFRD